MSIIDIKYCKKCGKAYDIDTSKDLCPECRRKKKNQNRSMVRIGAP